MTLTANFENEKNTLTKKVSELESGINTANDYNNGINQFVKLVGKYSEVEELDYENLHEFIDKILIHDLDRENNTRKIEIFYSFVGQINSGDKPVEDVTRIRKEMIDVKSYVI
jgi:site-specific recombinase XerD